MFADKEPRSRSSSPQRRNQEADKNTGVSSANVAKPTETVQIGKGKEKEKATTETPNDFSQFSTIMNEDLGKLMPEYWNDLDLDGNDNKIVELPREHRIFKLIENTMNEGIKQRPYTAPKKEKTRMAHSQDILDDLNSTKKQKDKAELRLKEGEKGGAPLVKSGEIEITKILVIYDKQLWDQFQNGQERVKGELTNAEDKAPLKKVNWSTTPAPVINQETGEALLFHGTNPDIIEKIVEGGFRPDLGRNKGTDTSPQYGLLGQGTYFTDSMSKMMTYATGLECKDYQCESEEDEAIVARVQLGHPKKKHGMLQPGGNLRDQSHDSPLKEGRHSVYSKGFQGSKNPFSAGSGTNEFLIKKSDQAYPELRIYYKRKKN